MRRRLPSEENRLGWAALRLLPATLGLLLLLSWLNLRDSGSASPAETSDPIEVVLSWVLDPSTELENGNGNGS